MQINDNDTNALKNLNRGNKNIIDCGFSKAIATGVNSSLELVCSGAGQTVAQSGGKLVVTAGTTANEETIIRTRCTINGEALINILNKRSQAIINNKCIMMLADTVGDNLAITVASATAATVTIPNNNPFYAKFIEFCTNLDGTVTLSQMVGMKLFIGALANVAGAIPERYAISAATYDSNGLYLTFTVASWTEGSVGTCSLFGWNFIEMNTNSATATSVFVDCCRYGYQSTLGYVSYTGASNTSATTYTILKKDAKVEFFSNLTTSSTAKSLLATREESLPNLNEDLSLYLIVRNGTTAPASGTTYEFYGYRMLDLNSIPVSLIGNNVAGTNEVTYITGAITSISAGTALIGDVSMQPRAVTGGLALVNRLLSAGASVNNTLVKNAAGRVYQIVGYNAAAAVRYLKVYNKATTPAAGTDTPVHTFALKPSDYFKIDFGAFGYYQSTGIGFALTTGSADNDTGALTAADIVGLNFYYA